MKRRSRSDSVRNTSDALRESGVRPHRSRGQNFLQDTGFAARVVQFAGVEPSDTVLEIGPGTGVLTREIVRITADLSVVEIESGLAKDLPKRVPGLSDERIINADIRHMSLPQIFPGRFTSPTGGEDLRIVVLGNIPYSISTDLLFWVFEQRRFIRRACFLMQHEFAARVAADAGGRTYGILSVFRALYAEATLGETISGDNFHPPAKVDSTVLCLEMRIDEDRRLIDDFSFQQVVRAAFSQRRKTLSNSLLGSGVFRNKDSIRGILKSASIDGKRRAETLTLDEFIDLANASKDELS